MSQVILFATAFALAAPILASQAPPAAQQPQAPAFAAPKNDKIPPADPHVAEALKTSRRHADWIDIKLAGGGVVRSWVVHPERPDKSGVVLVIHENRGINDWTRAVADQLAEDGFIAIAPDFLWGKGPEGAGTEALGAGGVSAALGALTRDEIIAKLNAAMEYGKSQSSSNGKTAVLGFCWGGRNSFDYAVAQPALNASVVFYGPSPQEPTAYASIKAPVLGLYGGNDARVNTTIPVAAEQMKALGKTFESHIFEGAAHGFVHQRSEADHKATVQSWPLVLAFLNKHLK